MGALAPVIDDAAVAVARPGSRPTRRSQVPRCHFSPCGIGSGHFSHTLQSRKWGI